MGVLRGFMGGGGGGGGIDGGGRGFKLLRLGTALHTMKQSSQNFWIIAFLEHRKAYGSKVTRKY